MTKPQLHPWLNTPEAVKAAERAAKIPEYKMPAAARALGADELFSEALAILTECALPPRERGHVACASCGGSLENVRAGAKFCSPQCRKRQAANVMRGKAEVLPAVPSGHIGSMWTWPEDERMSYAVREVGMRLCNYLRARSGRSEIPATPGIENAHVAEGVSEPEAREVIEDYLVSCGMDFDGTESLQELAEAAWRLRRFPDDAELLALWRNGDLVVTGCPVDGEAA